MTSFDSSRPPASPQVLTPSQESKSQALGFGHPKPGTDADPALLKTLQTYFGFGAFNFGQRDVIEAAIAGRDTAVFWATGSGKSICYQLPALHLKRTVVVVSPLISLMLDQVTKFNATAGAAPGGPRACFLGSAQVDPQVECDAVRGLYQLVYVTPEKLAASSILQRFKGLHAEGKLALLAVDEAHCISEWGHDFRPAYRQIRTVRQVIPGLPIMSLTATAVPRVRQDILEQLSMENPQVSQNSVDRPNLRLACTRKTQKQVDFNRIAAMAAEGGSTIVYAPTQAEVDTIAMFLRERLQPKGVEVRGYHGGMYGPDREAAHMDFLSGRAQIVVATVAFGMGIDKPDIRRIVHYGPPKTVEEYFQQVGRAGRDGLAATCELISSDNDFNNYASEFYTKGLTATAKELQLKSTEALRGFAAGCACRRGWLLKYFGETPPFGERCGTCDTCAMSAAHAGDLSRDFRQVAAAVFAAVEATEGYPRSLTQLLGIIMGTGNSTKPGWNSRQAAAVEHIKKIRAGMPQCMRREAFFREMISMLCEQGYLQREKKSMAVGTGTYVNTFEVYKRTAKGQQATGGQAEVRLPVPQALRQLEEEEKQRIEAKKQELVKSGVDLKKIPVQELKDGAGQTVDAHLGWARRLDHFRKNGQEDKATKMAELLSRILAWRDDIAQKLRMSPATVIAETLVLSIAYTQPTSVDALKAVGVRIVNVDELAALMQSSVQELFPKAIAEGGGNAPCADGRPAPAAAMLIPQGPWQPPMKWEKAVYKPGKGGKLPIWEEYYNRWAKGEHPQAIAVNPPNGKAVQVSTVCTNVLTALTHGKAADLGALARKCEIPLPNEVEWRSIEEGAATRGVNVDADDYKSKEVLCGILGPENVNMEHASKSEESKALEQKWYSRIRWWEALKRVRFPVQFESLEAEPAAKRPRLEPDTAEKNAMPPASAAAATAAAAAAAAAATAAAAAAAAAAAFAEDMGSDEDPALEVLREREAAGAGAMSPAAAMVIPPAAAVTAPAAGAMSAAVAVTAPTVGVTGAISSDQRARIEQNRMAALERKRQKMQELGQRTA